MGLLKEINPIVPGYLKGNSCPHVISPGNDHCLKKNKENFSNRGKSALLRSVGYLPLLPLIAECYLSLTPFILSGLFISQTSQ